MFVRAMNAQKKTTSYAPSPLQRSVAASNAARSQMNQCMALRWALGEEVSGAKMMQCLMCQPTCPMGQSMKESGSARRRFTLVMEWYDRLTPRDVRSCAGFWTPARRPLPRAVAAGVQKAPRHEVAGSWAPAVQRALWGFDGGAELEGGCDADRMRPADLHTGEIGSVE